MFVPGAMKARFADSVMNVPALAARPPDGATQTMTGTLAPSIDGTMFRSPRGFRRVFELDDDRGRVILGGPPDAVGDVAGEDAVDDPGGAQHDHVAPGGARARGNAQPTIAAAMRANQSGRRSAIGIGSVPVSHRPGFRRSAVPGDPRGTRRRAHSRSRDDPSPPRRPQAIQSRRSACPSPGSPRAGRRRPR